MKSHDSVCRDHHSFARWRIPSLTSAFTSDRQLAKALNGNRFACLKGRLDKPKNTFHDLGCFLFQDPCSLMNALGHIRLLHRRTFPSERPLICTVIVQTAEKPRNDLEPLS